MRHRLALTSLVLANTAVLLGGAAAATVVQGPVTTRTAHVAATAQVAPAPVAKPVVVHRPAARVVAAAPKAVRKAAPKPAPRKVVVRATAAPQVAALTPQQLMERAIARIPGYRTGVTRWVMTTKYGHWGIAELGGDTIYISPEVPAKRMYDVVAHEWSHMVSMKTYGNDVNAATAAMNAFFGGSGITGAEIAADCMARVLGASWTHYTSCANPAWRTAARLLLSAQRL